MQEYSVEDFLSLLNGEGFTSSQRFFPQYGSFIIDEETKNGIIGRATIDASNGKIALHYEETFYVEKGDYSTFTHKREEQFFSIVGCKVLDGETELTPQGFFEAQEANLPSWLTSFDWPSEYTGDFPELEEESSSS